MANARTVKILVKGRYYLTSFGDIKDILGRQGWQVVSVDYGNQVLFPDMIITANVLNEYSDSDILNNLRSDLSGLMEISNIAILTGSQAATIPINNSTMDALSNVAGGAGTIFGLSFGTAALIGIAAVYFLSRQSAPAVAYRRYYR